MTNLRLRYVQAWVDDEGRAHHYFRRRGFKRRALPGMPGSPEFMSEYTAAMAESPQPIGAETRSRPGTIAAAVAAYLDSTLHFGSRAQGTQDQHRRVLNRFRDKYGAERLAGMPRAVKIRAFNAEVAVDTKRTQTGLVPCALRATSASSALKCSL